jgi:hypothetical protein
VASLCPLPFAQLTLCIAPVRGYNLFEAYSSLHNISLHMATHKHMTAILVFLVKERRDTYGKLTKKDWSYHYKIAKQVLHQRLAGSC